jgi:hypothetical protein
MTGTYGPANKTPLARFKQQRSQARRRGIEWQLTFEEWLGIWSASGRWEQRGNRTGGFVMGRNGDVGPYSVTNVQIIPHSQNIAEGCIKNAGRGRGWTFVKSATRRPYQVVLSHRYIGSFATQAEAEAAYQSAAQQHRESFLAQNPLASRGQ